MKVTLFYGVYVLKYSIILSIYGIKYSIFTMKLTESIHKDNSQLALRLNSLTPLNFKHERSFTEFCLVSNCSLQHSWILKADFCWYLTVNVKPEPKLQVFFSFFLLFLTLNRTSEINIKILFYPSDNLCEISCLLIFLTVTFISLFIFFMHAVASRQCIKQTRSSLCLVFSLACWVSLKQPLCSLTKVLKV